MSDVLRLGGPAMAATAKDALNQSPERLRELANRDYWENTPLATAYQSDKDAANAELSRISALHDSWKITGLTTPGGFASVTDFQWPPGTSGDDGEDFHTQTGLTPWIADRFWKDESDFYEDATPLADAETVAAVEALGQPLYGGDPDPSLPEWDRQLALRSAYERLTDWSLEPTGADNARMFLSSGGFASRAPAPGTPEYRIAVEDLKTRFAACAWRDPMDPEKVLGEVTATAAAEWQQEISSQAAPRNDILTANSNAVQALTTASESMGKLLGHAWVADHITRWQDYWSSGGIGWIGTSPMAVQIPGATGKCLGVQGSGTANGTAVEVVTCSTAAAQQWRFNGGYGEGYSLQNVNSLKCLDLATNGTKIQIYTCNGTPAQVWKFSVRANTTLQNLGTNKCLNFPAYTTGQDALAAACSTAATQKVLFKVSEHNGTVPPSTEFTKASQRLALARTGAAAELAALKSRAAAATAAQNASVTAEQAAYAIADANGAPRGRGLLVGQQKAQVTQGAAAAVAALVKAGETAEAATRAAAADSATIAQRAIAQTAQSKAEFRKQAAYRAELQAKAAADAAKLHRDNAKKDKETAEAKLAEALVAESDAKAAAADAHAKRLAAEAEEATAKAEKEKAQTKRSEAAGHRKTAEAEAVTARDARTKAEEAEGTAQDRRDAAVKAKDHAAAMRDDAWEAEQKAEVARVKAAAKTAYADSLDAGAAADEARAAATTADQAADEAEAAAVRSRTAADAATQAAAEADAAATRAEAAAERARADADAAQAAKLRADAALRTATSAVADAIDASEHASAEAKLSVKAADEAERLAGVAKTQADEAQKQADAAVAASAKAAGFAYVTAQAAVDAGNAAAQVAAPANDAIQLGSPYVDTDAAAGLVVLTGQASKTIAEQQKAVADAHATNAAEEAAAAQAIATQAQGDAKAAYQHAANAAGHAATARGYSAQALDYAAQAATAMSKAVASLARTADHVRQAAEDAAAADAAAGRAEGHATQARDAADAAELDAVAARAAADRAEQDATEARAAADRADAAATEAEEAAKDAALYAQQAQEAADRAEKAAKAGQITTGTVPDGNGGSLGNVFYEVDHIEKVGDPQVISKTEECEGWIDQLAYRGGCTITSKIRYVAVLDLYLCTAEDLDPQKYTCPSEATEYIGQIRTDELSQTVTHTITMAEYQNGVDPVDILFGSWIRCAQKFAPGGQNGSWGGCAWAALDVASMFVGRAVKPIADALHAVNASFVTGIGVREALTALKALDNIDPAAVAAIERQVQIYEELKTGCRTNSFPGTTEVVLADGSRKALRDVRTGELLLASDPDTGDTRGEPVTRTFQHGADYLVEVTLDDGGRLTSTPGHQIFVPGDGWTLASDLRPGDTLRTPEGTRTVAAVSGRHEATPRTVYDVTVSGLNTFYAVAGDSPVLVHNCNDLVFDGQKFPGLAHTLDEHTAGAAADGLVDVTKARQLAESKGVNSVFVDQQTAQQVVDYALAGNANRIKDWLSKTRDPWFEFEGTFGAKNSLGTVYRAGGSTSPAGNRFYIKLVRVDKNTHGKHPQGFYVMTCYPKGTL
ncbi:RICIN domain-containing protein [Streptomyces chilikensis]|uniref:RICIN domain-containing protein n=1 Tax=Streptomyces chilikensis TaxID=1194079 RepID=A0ABV3EZ69_9ACTN